MKMWGRRNRTLPDSPVDYPVGICVATNKDTYLIQKDGKRYRISSKRALESWNFPLIVETSEAALSKYPVAVLKVGFRDGSLLNNIRDAKIYLVSGGKLRQVISPDVFARLGIKQSDAILVSDHEIKIMKLGDPIS